MRARLMINRLRHVYLISTSLFLKPSLKFRDEDTLWEKKVTQKRIPLKIDALTSARGTVTKLPRRPLSSLSRFSAV